jgi:hypothetical protein
MITSLLPEQRAARTKTVTKRRTSTIPLTISIRIPRTIPGISPPSPGITRTPIAKIRN